LGHRSVHVGHPLLGILRSTATMGVRALIHRGASLPRLRTAIAAELADAPLGPAESDGLTGYARQAVEQAIRTANGEQRMPDTLHLLEVLQRSPSVRELWPILQRATQLAQHWHEPLDTALWHAVRRVWFSG